MVNHVVSASELESTLLTSQGCLDGTALNLSREHGELLSDRFSVVDQK